MADRVGRYIISFERGSHSLPGVMRELHRNAGVAPHRFSLTEDRAAPEPEIGVLASPFGLGVTELEADAVRRLEASGVVRVRPERVFTLPRRFKPRAPPPIPAGLELAAPERSWGLDALGVTSGSPTGRGVRVAVLDSGLWSDHPDFVGRAVTKRSFVAGIAKADDDLGHGTFCAGIVAGPAQPSSGPRYGVAPDVDLFIARVLDGNERAREFDIIAALDWAIASRCRVVCLSLGALPGAAPDPDYQAIAETALRSGTLIVAAAGNDSVRPDLTRPVRVPANSTLVLAVAAAEETGAATSDSNAGLHPSNGGAVDLCGPGAEIYSACAPADLPYAIEGGTSAAAPFVVGVAAQWLEREPQLTAGKLWARLLARAKPPVDAHAAGFAGVDIGVGMVRAAQ